MNKIRKWGQEHWYEIALTMAITILAVIAGFIIGLVAGFTVIVNAPGLN